MDRPLRTMIPAPFITDGVVIATAGKNDRATTVALMNASLEPVTVAPQATGTPRTVATITETWFLFTGQSAGQTIDFGGDYGSVTTAAFPSRMPWPADGDATAGVGELHFEPWVAGRKLMPAAFEALVVPRLPDRTKVRKVQVVASVWVLKRADSAHPPFATFPERTAGLGQAKRRWVESLFDGNGTEVASVYAEWSRSTSPTPPGSPTSTVVVHQLRPAVAPLPGDYARVANGPYPSTEIPADRDAWRDTAIQRLAKDDAALLEFVSGVVERWNQVP